MDLLVPTRVGKGCVTVYRVVGVGRRVIRLVRKPDVDPLKVWICTLFTSRPE